MLCYFDSDSEVNLSYIPQVRGVRTLKELQTRLTVADFTMVTATEYHQPGLYLIEVSKIPRLWCAKTHADSENILLNIPSRVIKAAKQKKIRILIISAIEGDNFTSMDFDGFAHLHNTVTLLGLPKYSVCIVSGNLNAAQQYSEWCQLRSKEQLIEFLEGVEWDGKESNQLDNPVKIQEYSKIFNSLNRAHRPHRTEHLFFLAENKLLDSALVSGGAWFDEHTIAPSIYQEAEYNYYKSLLVTNYPRTVDVLDIKNTTPNLINNLEIYENSLLTVVTESHFDQTGGLFITEKTFRPILVGHPFVVLGQPHLLKKLESWGFKTDFLDTSYDSIEDDRERFTQFHKTLYTWSVLNAEIKRTMLYKWNNIILHNFQNYKKLNFKKTMFDNVILSTDQYFRKYS